MGFQIIGIVILLIFYGCYFIKMLNQHHMKKTELSADADVPKAAEKIRKGVEATGSELLASGTVIDKNGKVSYWCIGKKKEAVENPGTVYKEKVQKQLEEKRAEKKEKEKAEE